MEKTIDGSLGGREDHVLPVSPKTQLFPGHFIILFYKTRKSSTPGSCCHVHFGVGRTHKIISPGEGHGNPIQHSCLENPTDRGAWRAMVHKDCKESDMTEATEHTALLSAERGKAVASHLCQHILQRAEEKGHFLPAGFQIKYSLYSLGVHNQKNKIM